MTTLDLLVLLSIGAMAAWPVVFPYVSGLLKPRTAVAAAKPEAGSSIEEWRQSWAHTLIKLIDDIENGEGHFEDEKLALKLAKELLWEIIGGDGPTPSKGK